MTLDDLDRRCATEIMGDVFVPGVNAQWKNSRLTLEGWQPTRNIAQAWEVLEKIAASKIIPKENPIPHSVTGVSVHFTKCCRIDSPTAAEIENAKLYHCSIPASGLYYEASAESAALAIVKACLKAKGVEVE